MLMTDRGDHVDILSLLPEGLAYLNISLGGILHRRAPFASPCLYLSQFPFEGEIYDQEQCSVVESDFTSGNYKAESYACDRHTNWEIGGDKGYGLTQSSGKAYVGLWRPNMRSWQTVGLLRGSEISLMS